MADSLEQLQNTCRCAIEAQRRWILQSPCRSAPHPCRSTQQLGSSGWLRRASQLASYTAVKFPHALERGEGRLGQIDQGARRRSGGALACLLSSQRPHDVLRQTSNAVLHAISGRSAASDGRPPTHCPASCASPGTLCTSRRQGGRRLLRRRQLAAPGSRPGMRYPVPALCCAPFIPHSVLPKQPVQALLCHAVRHLQQKGRVYFGKRVRQGTQNA